MAHYPAFPGPGTAPSSTAPTAAEKAALDGASPPLSGTNVVVGADNLGPQLTANQAAAIQGASPPLSGTNVVVGADNLGPQLTANQAAAIQGATAPSATDPFVTMGSAGDLTSAMVDGLKNSLLGSSNLVAAQRQLVKIGFNNSVGSGGTVVTWATGLSGITSYKAILVIFPNAGGSATMVEAASINSSGLVTWNASTGTNDTILAFIFDGLSTNALAVS